jgi:hypothetical protein
VRSAGALVGAVAAVAAAIAEAVLLSASPSPGAQVAGMPSAVARELGSSPVVLTLRGDLLGILSPPEIDRLAGLEAAIARRPGVRAQYGPVTWLRATILEVRRAIATHATRRVTAADLRVRYGAAASPSIDDQSFVTSLVFGAGIAPARAVSWLFPTSAQARIFVRPARGASRSSLTRDLMRSRAPRDSSASRLPSDGDLACRLAARRIRLQAHVF